MLHHNNHQKCRLIPDPVHSMKLSQSRTVQNNSSSTGRVAPSPNKTAPSILNFVPLRWYIQSALYNGEDCTQVLVEKSQNTKRATGKVWKTFKLVRWTEGNKLLQFVKFQNCNSALSRKTQNGSNNLKMHSHTCPGNVDNVSKKA